MTEDWDKDVDESDDEQGPEKSMSSVVAQESLEQVAGDDSKGEETDES